MQSPDGVEPRARECQAGDGGRKRHELAFFEQQYVDQSVLRSQCGPSCALQAKVTRVNAVGLNALNKADLRFAEAEALLSSPCFLSRAFQSMLSSESDLGSAGIRPTAPQTR